jgi:ATP-dependent helicase HrpB
VPLGCALAALLSERDPLNPQEAGCDLLRRLDWLQQPGQDPRRHSLLQLQRQLQRQLQALPAPKRDQDAAAHSTEASSAALAGELVAHAYPERVALARPGQPGRYRTRAGRGAQLHPSDPLIGADCLAIASADGAGADSRIQLAAPLPRASLERLAEQAGSHQVQVSWDAELERVRCEREWRLGALVLERRPCAEAGADVLRQALLQGLRSLGLEALPWSPATRQLQQRLCLAHQHLGAPWPDRSDAALLADLEGWLGEQLEGLRSRAELQRLHLDEALWTGLDWAQRRELEHLLPTSLPIPSGREARLDYSSDQPVLAVKLQEMFGARSTPTVLAGRLPVSLHLLSPAGRPLAQTQDLESFWDGAYRQVRSEMRGRYPRHPWPEDPRDAPATALTKRRLEEQGQSQR